MDIDSTAPVVTRDEILVRAPLDAVWRAQTDISAWPQWRPEVREARFDGELAVGSVFHWEEGGPRITSTVREIVPSRRLVWTGPAQGIDAVHVWEFTPVADGVLVRTAESWTGEPVTAQAATLQPLLDASLRRWLVHLKERAERAATSSRSDP